MRALKIFLIIATLAVAGTLLMTQPRAATVVAYRVIVHPSNPAASVDRKSVV